MANQVTHTLTNPGAESGSANGWTATLGSISTRTTNPVPHTGSYYFTGTSVAEYKAYQQIDLVADGVSTASLDAGSCTFTATWFQASYEASDQGEIIVQFLDSEQAEISKSGSGFVATSPAKTWESNEYAPTIPANTRYVRLYMHGARNAGSNCDAYFDDLTAETSWFPAPPTGTLTLAGQAPNLSFTSPGAGSAALTGQAPSYINPNFFPVPAGTATITGQAPAFWNPTVFQIPTRQVRFTGFAPTMQDSVLEIDVPLPEIAFQTGLNAALSIDHPLPEIGFYTGSRLGLNVPLPDIFAHAYTGVAAGLDINVPLPWIEAQTGCNLALDVPLPSLSFSGEAEILAALALNVPLPSVALDAEVERLAQLAVKVPLPAFVLGSSHGALAELAFNLPVPSLSLSAKTGETATLNIVLPVVSPSFVLRFEPDADLAINVPLPAIAFNAAQAGRFDNYVLRYSPPA